MEAGDQNIFNWPSLVRVGKEALRYSVIFGQKSNSYYAKSETLLVGFPETSGELDGRSGQ